MESSPSRPVLRVSSPDQTTLSICSSERQDFARWLKSLAHSPTGEIAQNLYRAARELNTLILGAEPRFELLEMLRTDVHAICGRLEVHFLKRNAALDERARKVASLCQALETHLAHGYKLVAFELANQARLETGRFQLFGLALHRALSHLKSVQLRAAQLYQTAPPGLWVDLHQIYQLAASRGLHDTAVRDAHLGAGEPLSLRHAYTAALLLGAARCNQLRQPVITALWSHLHLWGRLPVLQSGEHPGNLFLVSAEKDTPPINAALLGETSRTGLLGLSPQPLMHKLEQMLESPPPESALVSSEQLSADNLRHLMQAWGNPPSRLSQRQPGIGDMTISLGMGAAHHYLSGGLSFNTQLSRPQETRTARFRLDNQVPDVWSRGYQAQAEAQNLHPNSIDYHIPGLMPVRAQKSVPPATGRPADKTEAPPVHVLSIINQSEAGYCLKWPGPPADRVLAGELIALRNSPEQPWLIGVIRWLNQNRAGDTPLGIEVLADSARPCGLRLLQKTGQDSHYLRALILPSEAEDGAVTLLAPRLPFQSGNKVVINIEGEERRAVLGRTDMATASFSRFEFRFLDRAEAPKPAQSRPSSLDIEVEDFDSLWKSL